MVKKLLHDMSFSVNCGQPKKLLCKSLFFKIKIWNWLFRFISTWKALNHSILMNESKVMKKLNLWISMASRDSTPTRKLNFLITFDSLINMEWFKAFPHRYKSKESISKFYLFLKWFLKNFFGLPTLRWKRHIMQ